MKTAARATIEVFSPFDGSLVGTVPAMTPPEIEAAIDTVAAGQAAWAAVPLEERIAMLRRARDLMGQRKRELSEAIAREQGKPKTEAITVELMTSLEYLSWCIHEAPKHLEPVAVPHRHSFLAGKYSRSIFVPRGVTSIIPAWNYPLFIPLCQIATCIVAGNGVVYRPSSTTPIIARMTVELLREAGVPASALQLITCASSNAERLVTHPAVKAVVFTGSNEVGQKLLRLASQDGLRRVILELGGKDPFVVFDDADVERAARGAVWGAFFNAGQTCASAERFYVQRGVVESFTRRVVELTGQLKMGDPTQRGIDIGPMTTADGAVKVAEHVADAVARGARVLVGGNRSGHQFFEPTVLADATHEMRCMREETFGPLLPIMAFDTEDEAVRLANDSEYGLTASVWTRDQHRARRVANRLEAGSVHVNDVSVSVGEPQAPWGGLKASGLGCTHSRFGLFELMETKFISEDYTTRHKEMWWYPYDADAFAFFSTAIGAMYGPAVSHRLISMVGLANHFDKLRAEADLGAMVSRTRQLLFD